jgi:transketolase
MRAAEQLSALGIHCRVLSMHTLKPFDVDSVLRAAAETGGIVTVEENTVIGGLGGAVAEACLEGGVPPRRFHRIGMRDQFSVIVGDQAFLRRHYGMDAHAIVTTVKRLLGNAGSSERPEAVAG